SAWATNGEDSVAAQGTAEQSGDVVCRLGRAASEPATSPHASRDSPTPTPRLADTQTATRPHPDRDSPGGRHLGERLRRVPQAAASPARVHAPWPVPRPASPVVAR